MLTELLAPNATKWERVVTDSLDTWASLDGPIVAIRGTKIIAPPPRFLPFLIYEYGLGELTPYVPNLYDLIAEGIDWQRIRGTPAAVALALSWLDYTAVIEEERSTRRYWNLFQLRLDRVRDARADLDRIEGVAKLSVPLRSVFWRGFHGLDIRPLTFSHSSYSNAHFGEYSGVRLRQGGPLWSFGRKYPFDVSLIEADLVELGVWLEPVEGDEDLGWGDFSWNDTESSWQSSASLARSQAMASGVLDRSVWFAFMDVGGDVIGYRRARTARAVAPAIAGNYDLAGVRYAPVDTGATMIYAECQTGFGDGDGQVAKSVGLVFDCNPDPDLPPGTAWLEPDQLASDGTAPVAVNPVDISFGESIRERVQVLLRF